MEQHTGPNVDFDCEYHQLQVATVRKEKGKGPGTDTIVRHLCTFGGKDPKKRCDLTNCPKQAE